MRNSTLRKMNMSKERVHALDELIPNKAAYYDSSPGVYLRSDKDRELDILWQGFKINHREERSPGFYLTAGFITGALCAIFLAFMLNFSMPKNETTAGNNFWNKSQPKTTVNVTPSTPLDSAEITKTTQYVIKSGDTLGAIAYKFYGNSSPSKIAKIQSVNKLRTPDDLQINQKLIIPVED